MTAWFNKGEIYELTTPVMERIIASIRTNKIDEAIDLCDLLREERIILHDFFADACTALYTWIGRNLGEERLKDMFTFSLEQSARRQIYDLVDPSLNRGLEAFTLARGCWVAHSCSGAGEHGGAFRLEEDDERFTFVLDPCGSGGRLWRKRRYEPPFDFALTERSYPWSYNRKGYPYYCVHCFFMNELLPYHHLGFTNWPVEPPEYPMDVCRWHLYKDRYAVPGRYYERFALEKPSGSRRPRSGKGRWFSEEQLAEMARPTPERIRERLQGGRHREALRIASRMKGEFFFLHHTYVNMLVTTLDFIIREAGDDRFWEALSSVYDTCVREQIMTRIEGLQRKDALSFIIRNIFLADTCGGAGMPSPRIAVEEDASEVRIILDPCASGGKLIQRRAYEPLKSSTRFRESMENRLMKLSLKIPLPRRLLEFTTPIALDYFSDHRRPEGMEMTHKPHQWSNGRYPLPLYCCFCKVFLRKADCDWLDVSPPAGTRETCIWRAKK